MQLLEDLSLYLQRVQGTCGRDSKPGGNSQGETSFSMVDIEQKHQRKTGAVTDENYMSLIRIMLSHSQMESHRPVLNIFDDVCSLSMFRIDHGVVLSLH